MSWAVIVVAVLVSGALADVRQQSLEEFLGEPEHAEFTQRVTESNIKFYLYTRYKPYGFRLFRNNLRNLRDSHYNPIFPTKILIHGYMNNITADAIQLPKDAYLSVGAYNIIGVDWSAYTFPYVAAASSARDVGHVIGDMITYLHLFGGLQQQDLHIIGHSLGCHVASFAGEVMGMRVYRITGMDPAAPLFADSPPSDRLGAEDADFVDIIHTSIRFLGMMDSVGHYDFYPNGGCDHSEAYKYFAESILRRGRYIGVHCDSVKEAVEGECRGGRFGVMGDEAIYVTSPGIYHVDVRFLSAPQDRRKGKRKQTTQTVGQFNVY